MMITSVTKKIKNNSSISMIVSNNDEIGEKCLSMDMDSST